MAHLARTLVLASFSLTVMVQAPQAFAAGGGMGASIPSSREPQYDPAEEFRTGVAAYEAQNYKSAAAAFKRVIAAVPKHGPAQYLLGASYIGQGDYKKAKRPLELAVKYDDSLVEAHRDLAITYAKLGKPAEAAKQQSWLTVKRAECAAKCAEAVMLEAALKAVAAEIAGNGAQVVPQAMWLGSRHSPAHSVDATYVAAVGLINEQRYVDAIGQLTDALYWAGPEADILTYLGFANRKLGRYEVARGWYEMALDAAPDHLGAIEYYGELKLEMGDVAGARDHLARLDQLCAFGCQQADELRRWLREAKQSAS